MPIRPLPLLLLAAAACAADVPCPRFVTAPAIDGDLADWKGRPTLTMSEATSVDDLKVEQACLGWDDNGLYLGLSMADTKLLNLGKGSGIANGDCADLRLVLPDGRVARLLIAPVTDGGGPALHLSTRSEVKGPVTELAAAADPKADAKGVVWAVKTTPTNWTVEAMVPWALLKQKPAEGLGLPVVLVAWDRDQPDDWKEWHRRSESANQKKQEAWPKLVLAK